MSVHWEQSNRRWVVRFRDADGRNRSVTANAANFARYGLARPGRLGEQAVKALEAAILRRQRAATGAASPAAKHLTWQKGLVTPRDRAALLGQRGCVVWLTGLSGSGKSTVANALERRLIDAGRPAFVLDGDNVRHGLNGDLGFSPADRDENIRRIGEVAALFANAGLIAITAFISPYRAGRDRARRAVGTGRFIEVFLDAPLGVCQQRDPKGLYQKARAGQIRNMTGVSAPYEPPRRPELRLKTARLGVADCAAAIHALLKKRGFLSARGARRAKGGRR